MECAGKEADGTEAYGVMIVTARQARMAATCIFVSNCPLLLGNGSFRAHPRSSETT